MRIPRETISGFKTRYRLRARGYHAESYIDLQLPTARLPPPDYSAPRIYTGLSGALDRHVARWVGRGAVVPRIYLIGADAMRPRIYLIGADAMRCLR